MANNSRTEIRAKLEGEISAIEYGLVALNTTTNTVNEYVEKLDESDNEPLLFTYTKISSSVAKDGETLLQHMKEEWTENESMFFLDASLITDETSLGRLGVHPVVKEYKATFQQKVNIVRNDYEGTCITDMCFMDSNDLIIADGGNCKLKRYTCSTDLVFKDELQLLGGPYSICNIGENNVAVRINGSKVVNIISVEHSMKKTSSFTITGDGSYGLAFDDTTGELYAVEKERLCVYTKTGNKLRTYDKDENGKPLFRNGLHVALSKDRQTIYLTDYYEGLIVLDKNGALKMNVLIQGFLVTVPLCLLPGDICIAGTPSESAMVQVDKYGEYLGTIIDSYDGGEMTYCVVYDREHSRLIFGRDGSISIYTLSPKCK